MKPCRHETAHRGCPLCRLYATDPRYRALWDHAVDTGPPSVAPRHSLPCIYLGTLVERAACLCGRFDRRHCDRGHGVVTQAQACEECADYETDG